MSSNLQWLRIIMGAILLEVALIIAFVPLLHLSLFSLTVIAPFLPVVALLLGFVISWWFARQVRARPFLHGSLMGLLATVIYIDMCALQPGGIASVIAKYGTAVFYSGNALRILGCAAGGFTAHIRKP
jgi:hypothetical protein